MIASLGEIARALGGEIVNGQVLAPGPGHSRKDRSLCVKLSPTSPTGFIVHSHAHDDWRACQDYVRDKLGLAPPNFRPATPKPARKEIVRDGSDKLRVDAALRIWHEARDPRGTILETYLASRKLDLPEEVAGTVLRFHPECPWREGETAIRVPAMVAAMRSIATDEIVAIHRTRLSAEGAKVDRRMLGTAAGAAIKLDADEAVTLGLTLGEGIETCVAARQLGFTPVWALGSCGAIASFPVLAGIECLTLLAENDTASERACRECGDRWHAADREVIIASPHFGKDINDAIRETRR